MKELLTYQRALNIVDHFPETTTRRVDCIELLQQAGYSGGLNQLPYSKIADDQLFRAAKATRERAEMLVKKQGTKILAHAAAVDNVYALYAAFNFNFLADDAPEPEELEEKLWRE
mgnify:CR=1 FL=1